MRKIIEAGVSAEEIREILQETLQKFKDDLIQEIRKASQRSQPEINLDNSPVSTNEICRRWGKSRTTIAKLVKSKALIPSGKYKRQFLFLTSHITRLFGQPVCDRAA